MGLNTEMRFAEELADACRRLVKIQRRPAPADPQAERLRGEVVKAMASMLDELGLNTIATDVTSHLWLFDDKDGDVTPDDTISGKPGEVGETPRGGEGKSLSTRPPTPSPGAPVPTPEAERAARERREMYVSNLPRTWQDGEARFSTGQVIAAMEVEDRASLCEEMADVGEARHAERRGRVQQSIDSMRDKLEERTPTPSASEFCRYCGQTVDEAYCDHDQWTTAPTPEVSPPPEATEKIKEVRARTQAGMGACKRALVQTAWDVTAACELLTSGGRP